MTAEQFLYQDRVVENQSADVAHYMTNCIVRFGHWMWRDLCTYEMEFHRSFHVGKAGRTFQVTV